MRNRRALLLTALLVSCDSPEGPGSQLAQIPACDGQTRGTLHNVTSNSHHVWTRDGSPHVVAGPMSGAVTVEAGVVVCVLPNLMFRPGPLVARGTADAPIVFMPVDGAATWKGLTIPAEGDGMPAELEHVHIRSTAQAAIVTRRGTLDNVVIENACRDGGYCYAIEVPTPNVPP